MKGNILNADFTFHIYSNRLSFSGKIPYIFLTFSFLLLSEKHFCKFILYRVFLLTGALKTFLLAIRKRS